MVRGIEGLDRIAARQRGPKLAQFMSHFPGNGAVLGTRATGVSPRGRIVSLGSRGAPGSNRDDGARLESDEVDGDSHTRSMEEVKCSH